MKQLQEKSKIYGTSFFGYEVRATMDQLEKVFGFAPEGPSADGKVEAEWDLETEYGVFSVYSWKEYREISGDEEIYWHIGGRNGDLCERFKKDLEQALENVTPEEDPVLNLISRSKYLSAEDIARRLGVDLEDDRGMEIIVSKIMDYLVEGKVEYSGRWGGKDYYNRKP